MSDSKRQTIDDKICLLMEIYGPDGHIDGHDKITDYICELLELENKSLRESIADLQKALDFVTKKIPDKHPAISNAWAALERLKARGHWVEEKK